MCRDPVYPCHNRRTLEAFTKSHPHNNVDTYGYKPWSSLSKSPKRDATPAGVWITGLLDKSGSFPTRASATPVQPSTIAVSGRQHSCIAAVRGVLIIAVVMRTELPPHDRELLGDGILDELRGVGAIP
eukprot:SAG25_NODE_3697_length_995_cov_1.584821_3_plen_127_part_01